MFVESMSFVELRAEFEKDWTSVLRKIRFHANDVLKYIRKNKIKSYDKYFDYVSLRKNRWLYRFRTTPGMKGNLTISQYTYFMTKKSYAVMVYSVQDGLLIYHTSHFFTRYFQRLDLGSDKVHEIIQQYMRENTGFVAEPLTDSDAEIYQAFIQLNTGVGLGYFHKSINLMEMRTFISGDMLKGDQVELSKQLKEEFNSHLVRDKPED